MQRAQCGMQQDTGVMVGGQTERRVLAPGIAGRSRAVGAGTHRLASCRAGVTPLNRLCPQPLLTRSKLLYGTPC